MYSKIRHIIDVSESACPNSQEGILKYGASTDLVKASDGLALENHPMKAISTSVIDHHPTHLSYSHIDYIVTFQCEYDETVVIVRKCDRIE
jgi:hypothetical protein